MRVRNLYLSLLLLFLPACGLSDYEALMREAQEREQHFRAESKYLDEPVKVPTRKEKVQEKEFEVPVANVFFRPPKGIQSAFRSEPRHDLLWSYTARGNAGDFALVEMAFGDDKKEFASDVLRHYQVPEEAKPRTQQFRPPGREALTFNIWDFDDAQASYTIALWQSGKKQIAIAYIFAKGRRESAGKAIELSLESLAVDSGVNTAYQKYRQKSPWRLGTAPIR
jgi:hypothetical protein